MKRLWIVALVCIGLPLPAFAGGFAVGEQSARTAGAGSAGAAGTGDASSAWFNPAAAPADGWYAAVGVNALRPALSASSESFQAQSRAVVKTPPHAYLTYGTEHLVTGVSVNVPFGSSVTWPDDWDGRFEAVDSSIQVVRVAPFAGWRFERLRLAAGPHVDWMTVGSARKIDFVDTQGDVDLALSGVGVGAHAAVQYVAHEQVIVGITFKSPTHVRLDGDADFTVPEEFNQNAPDQGASSAMTLPAQLVLGVRYQATPDWAFLVDSGLTTWGSYQELRVDFESDATTDLVRPTEWENQVWLRAGAEYALAEKWVVRGGGFFDPTPAPASTLVPSSPDGDRLGLTAGASWQMSEAMSLDGFVAVVQLLERSSANPESLGASYAGRIYMGGVGIRFH